MIYGVFRIMIEEQVVRMWTVLDFHKWLDQKSCGFLWKVKTKTKSGGSPHHLLGQWYQIVYSIWGMDPGTRIQVNST